MELRDKYGIDPVFYKREGDRLHGVPPPVGRTPVVLPPGGEGAYRGPEGPDGGMDILGPLGFGSPRTCVQVKSQDSLVESPEIDQLMGVMKKVQANEALFVSISS